MLKSSPQSSLLTRTAVFTLVLAGAAVATYHFLSQKRTRETKARETKAKEKAARKKARRAARQLRVPKDCSTLQEAVDRVRCGKRLTTIVLGKGEHQIDGDYCTLYIRSAMNIVGDPEVPKEEIVVLGNIKFEKEIQGNCHLQHLTLRYPPRVNGGSGGSGVDGSSSFTIDDVIVEKCGAGVKARGLGVVGVCTNLEVRQCGTSGVEAYGGASITLIGAKTTVHHNCTSWDSDYYGLCVDRPPSTIQLVAPLTKENVSTDNGRSGNFGYYGKDPGSAVHIKSLGHSIYQIKA